MMTKQDFIRALRVPALGVVMVTGIVLALYGVWRMGSYSYPMLSENFRGAAQSSVGDPPVALYDFGVQAYKAGNPKLAKDALTEAFNQLTKNTGVTLPEGRNSPARSSSCWVWSTNKQSSFAWR